MAAKLSGSSGKKYDIQQNADINVTPFVDVMLVLLIIFMVAAPLATVSIKLDFPPFLPPPPNQKKPPDPVYISIQQSGSIFIAEKQTTPDTLDADLAKVFKDRGTPQPDQKVFIRADKDVQYGKFMEVMDNLEDGGFTQVGLLAEDIE
jgi:biopolymer transport protein ExbD